MNRIMIMGAVMAVAGWWGFGTPAIAQTTVSSFAPSANQEPGVWYENDVRSGGTASITDLTDLGGDLETNQPSPSGAAKLTTDFTNAAKAEVGISNDYGQPQNILSTLSISFSYHKGANPGQAAAPAPSLKLAFYNPVCDDPTSNGDCYGSLVWEAYQQGSGSPTVDEWATVTIDKDNGLFWSTGLFGEGNGSGGCPSGGCLTLSQWFDELSSDFSDATLVLVSIGVGSYNQGQVGYFDDVKIFGTSVADMTYDFEPATPDITIAPTSNDFGDVIIGSSSPSYTFEVTNIGDGDLNIGTISLTGTHSSEFSTQFDYCSGLIISPLGTCTVDVNFNPTSEGAKTSSLSIPSNDPDTPVLEVALNGTGINAPIDISINHVDVEFKNNSNDRYHIKGEFTLDPASDGIDPINEDVTVTVGSFPIIIEAGLFTEKKGKFELKANENEFGLTMKIEPRGDHYKFEVKANHVDLTGNIVNPVNFGLSIGNDVGESTISLKGKLKLKKGK